MVTVTLQDQGKGQSVLFNFLSEQEINTLIEQHQSATAAAAASASSTTQ
jgi:ribosomal protein L12E/L44/L45/RPP1/RPP2